MSLAQRQKRTVHGIIAEFFEETVAEKRDAKRRVIDRCLHISNDDIANTDLAKADWRRSSQPVRGPCYLRKIEPSDIDSDPPRVLPGQCDILRLGIEQQRNLRAVNHGIENEMFPLRPDQHLTVARPHGVSRHQLRDDAIPASGK